jgi:hypothetical protein
MTTTLTIRTAHPADAASLVDLARLDSARPLAGEVLVAEAGGRAVAALSLADHRAVADPFVASGPAVEVLRMRAAQLRATAATTALRARRPRLRAATG